jgi:hypothetical protein
LAGLAWRESKGYRRSYKRGAGHDISIPPYSPDLNPVEETRSKLKAYPRKEKARITGDLPRAAGARLNSLMLLVPLPVNASSSRRSSGFSMISLLVLLIGITLPKK